MHSDTDDVDAPSVRVCAFQSTSGYMIYEMDRTLFVNVNHNESDDSRMNGAPIGMLYHSDAQGCARPPPRLPRTARLRLYMTACKSSPRDRPARVFSACPDARADIYTVHALPPQRGSLCRGATSFSRTTGRPTSCPCTDSLATSSRTRCAARRFRRRLSIIPCHVLLHFPPPPSLPRMTR